MNPYIELPIPEHWSAEQAAAVHEFLEQLLAAVWSVHGENIVRLYEAELLRHDERCLDVDDEELPF